MPTPSRFPSALRRSDGGDIDLDTPRRREPTTAAIAMMDSKQYEAYMRSRGEWAEPDYEALREARRQNDYSR